MKGIIVIIIILILPKVSLAGCLGNEIDSNVVVWVDNFLRDKNPDVNFDDVSKNMGFEPSSLTFHHIELLGKYRVRFSKIEIYQFGLNISHGSDCKSPISKTIQK